MPWVGGYRLLFQMNAIWHLKPPLVKGRDIPALFLFAVYGKAVLMKAQKDLGNRPLRSDNRDPSQPALSSKGFQTFSYSTDAFFEDLRIHCK
jgi:hypothetical protein